ncbi:pyridoxal-phosphate dependent enzyme [Carboxylicivirga sp. M1479]|uniref:pyridoxal-phosphate dependent enzyme n=1 Tax=Carboxylicivirga sp. M1479 TaxID=2594476 RepID=UPI00117884F3|nr:pyridoxal-phosphate dependent enzyme [Carboxylicivirga sp. M1479]TRX72272.1 pyridoxal-phosphate dependent enzyme [Carboxylicivirga sp. M1479]
MLLPTSRDVIKAYDLIKPIVHCTPVLSSQAINQITGADVYFKCENFQKVGAFKYRGATNAVLSLTDEQKKNGVATHSSGNHAAALALAAANNGVMAYIVMPKNAPEIKKVAVAGYGAEITFCEPTLEAREQTLNAVIAKTGATLVHPYNQFEVICGQGTSSLELMQQVNSLDIVMTPVGGGGLLSGSATYLSEEFPEVKIIAAEPAMASDAYQSFKSGEFHSVVNPNTIADGLRTSLGDLTFEIIKSKVHEIYTVSEQSIVAAMRLIWERMKIIVEPSSAVPLAVLLENKAAFKHQKVGIILTGGNVDLEKLPFSSK